MNKVLFSHNSDEWSTPDYLFSELNDEFNFNYDPCATHENHKTEMYSTIETDGLSTSWSGLRVFCNPPYSKAGKWVEKASREDALTVMLIPARTDTRWFHDFIYKKAEIRFIRGRVRFGDGKKDAPFPSMIVIFRRLKEYD